MEETSGGQGAAVGRKIGESLPKQLSIVDQPQPSCAWSRLCQINTLLGLKGFLAPTKAEVLCHSLERHLKPPS